MATRSGPEDEASYRWLEAPGIFCDYYFADYYSDSKCIRITFGEWVAKGVQPFYRTAVVLPLSDAKALRKTLDRLIHQAEVGEDPEVQTEPIPAEATPPPTAASPAKE